MSKAGRPVSGFARPGTQVRGEGKELVSFDVVSPTRPSHSLPPKYNTPPLDDLVGAADHHGGSSAHSPHCDRTSCYQRFWPLCKTRHGVHVGQQRSQRLHQCGQAGPAKIWQPATHGQSTVLVSFARRQQHGEGHGISRQCHPACKIRRLVVERCDGGGETHRQSAGRNITSKNMFSFHLSLPAMLGFCYHRVGLFRDAEKQLLSSLKSQPTIFTCMLLAKVRGVFVNRG